MKRTRAFLLLRRMTPFCPKQSVWLGTALLCALLSVAGCTGNSKSIVSGKVTVNGKPAVEGSTLIFIGADNKEISAIIAGDGNYTMIDPPQGQVKVVVRGLSSTIGRGKPVAKVGTDMPGMSGQRQGEPIPPRYAKPDNGLSFNVTGGKQTFNVELNS